MAKKKRRRGSSGAAAVDPNEKRRERLEARRKDKEAALAAARRVERRERLVRYVMLGSLFALAAWFFFFRGKLPDEIGGSTIQHLSTAGANDHVDTPVQYESTPPVSGAHATNPAPCGMHGEPIPNENFVHTMEHGAVAIVYKPDLDPAEIERIEAIVSSFDDHTLSAPNAEMDSPVAVAAWANLMKLDSVDEPAIREFIEVFRGDGSAPEAKQPCPNTADSPFAPAQPSPSPTETAEKGAE